MKLEVTRGIECGERVCGDESGECGFRGERDGGVGCGSNRVKLRLKVEMRVIMRVIRRVLNVEMIVEMVMLKRLILLVFLFLINLNLLFQLPLFLSYNFSFSPITSRYNSITFHYNHYNY